MLLHQIVRDSDAVFISLLLLLLLLLTLSCGSCTMPAGLSPPVAAAPPPGHIPEAAHTMGHTTVASASAGVKRSNEVTSTSK
jgi:hypothetical protein